MLCDKNVYNHPKGKVYKSMVCSGLSWFRMLITSTKHEQIVHEMEMNIALVHVFKPYHTKNDHVREQMRMTAIVTKYESHVFCGLDISLEMISAPWQKQHYTMTQEEVSFMTFWRKNKLNQGGHRGDRAQTSRYTPYEKVASDNQTNELT